MVRKLAGSMVSMVLAGMLAAPVWTEEKTMGVDERAIRSLEDQEVKAILEADVAALERLLSEQYIVNNPQNGVSLNRSFVVDRVRQGLISYTSFEKQIEAIRFSGDIAIVMGSETVVPKGNAPRAGQTVHRRFTNIWARSGSTWKGIARHANVIAER